MRNWILEKANDLKYRFGSAGIDPSSQTEDLGDNAVKASEYGIANLKRILPNWLEWSTVEGEDYSDLKEMYNTLLSQFRRYMGHVANNIGGVYQFYKTADQDGAVYTHVSKEHQKACVNFLNNHLFNTRYWMSEKDILNKIESAGMNNRIRTIQSRYVNKILDIGKRARRLENDDIKGDNAKDTEKYIHEVHN